MLAQAHPYISLYIRYFVQFSSARLYTNAPKLMKKFTRSAETYLCSSQPRLSLQGSAQESCLLSWNKDLGIFSWTQWRLIIEIWSFRFDFSTFFTLSSPTPYPERPIPQPWLYLWFTWAALRTPSTSTRHMCVRSVHFLLWWSKTMQWMSRALPPPSRLSKSPTQHGSFSASYRSWQFSRVHHIRRRSRNQRRGSWKAHVLPWRQRPEYGQWWPTRQSRKSHGLLASGRARRLGQH